MNNQTLIEVHMFPCLEDNYGYLVHDPASGLTATIDTPEVEPIERALHNKGWQLDYIFNTHHHFDHAGGNLELKDKTGCRIVGPAADADRIPGIDIRVSDGETFELGEQQVTVFETPGHTRGHIVYYFRDSAAAFVGDTLFALGCGRLFEGTPRQMWASLSKLLKLPDDTQVYCAHEYTLANARFAVTVDPENSELLTRMNEIVALREANRPTIPTSIGLERATNPFMRPDSAGMRAALNMPNATDVEVFAEVRSRKDKF
jgi:hydroxyacylglutathione hydrolase